MLIHRTRFLTQGEVWFDEEPDNAASVDWILYYRRSEPVPRATWSYTYTAAIDLNRSVEQLKAQLNADTAYKIRRACERDKIKCESCDATDPEVLKQFEGMYNSFASLKGLQPLERGRAASMVAASRLDISVAKDPAGNVLGISRELPCYPPSHIIVYSVAPSGHNRRGPSKPNQSSQPLSRLEQPFAIQISRAEVLRLRGMAYRHGSGEAQDQPVQTGFWGRDNPRIPM